MNRLMTIAGDVLRIEEKISEELERTQDSERASSTTPLTTQPQQQGIQAKQNQFDIEFHYDIIQEREEKINRIGHAIGVVNNIMKELGDMVLQQGETLDLLETNIEESMQHSKKAVEELSKSEKKNRDNGKRKCLLIMLVAILLFVSCLFFIESIRD